MFLRKPAPVKVELLPYSDSPPAWDGSYPHLLIVPTKTGSEYKFESSISLVKPSLEHGFPVSEFDVDLHSGRFVLRQTDIFVADVMPLSLTRTYTVWDDRKRAFGVGTNHPYDICPTGRRFPYTYMDLNLEDDRQIHFPRISKGTGYADAVFRHSNTASEFYGAQVAWNGNGWTLDFRDGREILFPEAYYSKSFAQGAPYEMRDGKNHRIMFKRDGNRNLEELISPAGHTISFSYDGADRIVAMGDDSGTTHKYSYNSTGHLETVSDGARVLYRFEYQPLLRAAGFDPYLMTMVLDGDWKIVLQNVYKDGSRISEQRLADGTTLKYAYVFDDKHEIEKTTVTLPSGKVRTFSFQEGVPSGAQ